MSVTTDATSGIAIPQSSAEWGDSSLSPYWTTPDHLWLCQELLGNLADSIGTMTLTKSGTTQTYFNSVTGWSTKAVHIELNISGSCGFTNTGTGLDVLNASALWLMYVRVTGAPAGPTTIVSLGGSASGTNNDLVAQLTTAPHLTARIQSSGQTDGTANPNGAGVIPLLLQWDKTNQVYRIFTTQERIDGVFVPSSTFTGTGTKGIGTISSNANSGPIDILYMAAWKGVGAEMSDFNIRAGLNALGWSATSSFVVTYTAGLADNTSTDHRLDVAVSNPVGVSESATTSATIAAALTAQPPTAESLATDESAMFAAANVQGVSESVSVAEQLDHAMQFAPAISETDTTSESVAAVAAYAPAISETDTTSEAVAAEYDALQALAETPATVELLAVASQPVVNLSETVATTDSNAIGATYVANVNEAAADTYAEAVATGQTFGLALAEIIAINEEVDAQTTITQVPDDIRAGELMGYVELGRTLRIALITTDRVGQVVDADSTPTMTLLKQGSALGYSPPVTHVTTGTYEVVIAITSGNSFEIDKEVSSYFTTVINGVTVRRPGPSFVPQTFSPDDVMERLGALSNRKSVIDGGSGHANIQRAGDGFATFTRVRVFADSKDLTTVTKGAADNADGELYRYFYTGVEDGSTGRLGNMTMDVKLEPTEP